MTERVELRKFQTKDTGSIHVVDLCYAPHAPEYARRLYPPEIKGKIFAEELIVGVGVRVEEGVVITGKEGPAKRVVLGDFSYIGEGVKILTPEFSIGDYTKLNARSFVHGVKPIQIGRNCWFGGSVVLDSMGGLDIDDNVGIGAHSHVWTHMQFGDIVEGSRFYSQQYMYVARDVWLVGECKLHPVRVGERSLALEGSVVTRDMLPNHVYAGVPAKDVTSKFGLQFERRTPEQKAAKLRELIVEFELKNPHYTGRLQAVTSTEEITNDYEITYFDLSKRTYTKRYNPAEVAFLKSKVPLVKFAPAGETNFVVPQQVVEPFGETPYESEHE